MIETERRAFYFRFLDPMDIGLKERSLSFVIITLDRMRFYGAIVTPKQRAIITRVKYKTHVAD